MGIKVTVNSTAAQRVSVNNQQRQVVRTIGIGGNVNVSGVDTLVELGDVDATSVDNNETLVYDENSQKFVIKELPVIKGGTF